MAKINGIDTAIAKGTTIGDYIEQNGFNLQYIAVECNGTIVPKGSYNTTLISNNDTIEIVNFVGGG